MSFTYSCHQCDAEYEIQDQHIGRRFRCKQCSAICTAEKPEAAADSRPAKNTNPTSNGSNQRKPRPETPARPRKKAVAKDDYDDVEIVEKKSSRDEYEEYEEYEDADAYEDYEDEYEERTPRRSNPSRKRGKPSRKRGKSESFGERFKGLGTIFGSPFFIWSIPFIGGISIPLLAYIHSYLGFMVAGPMLVFGIGLSIYGGFKSIKVAFDEEFMVGIFYLFVPFYSLYHILTRFDEHLPALGCSFYGFLLIVFGEIGIVVAGIAYTVNGP